MINILNKTECCGCAVCADVCPKECIMMVPDEDGFAYPAVMEEKCIGCNQCDSVCPVLNPPAAAGEAECYAAYNINSDITLESSSGGVFHALAMTTIEQSGAVFGASFDENMYLRHSCAENEKQLAALLGSKYVQSDMSMCYKTIAKKLNSGKVLFCGTPCQCAAVKNRFNSDNLITAALICHGVPSPLMWRRYIEYCESGGKKVTGCNMRDKSGGWVNYNFTLDFSDGTTFSEIHKENPYFAAYLNDGFIRPICSECKFKNAECGADIILGDLWSADKICGKFASYLGTGAVMVMSKKGRKLLDGAREKLNLKKINREEIEKYNAMLKNSAKAGNAPVIGLNFGKYEVKKLSWTERIIKARHDCLFRKALKKR